MIPKGTTHHSILVIGDMETMREKILVSVSEVFNTTHKGNPDFHIEEIVSVGIDESRKWRDMQSVAPMSGDVKVFIISFGTMTNEAQNALLKVVEEPAPSTRFVFVTRSTERLLPTFISRLLIIDGEDKKNNSTEAVSFLKTDIAKRIEIVKKIVGDKDRVKMRWFIEGIGAELRSYKKSDTGTVSALKDIESALSYSGDISSSPKLILESLALTLPRL